MRTSNAALLAEIDTLEEVTRKDSKDLEVVKTIEKLEFALAQLINKAEECDGWEHFPSEYLDNAREVLNT